MTPKGNHFNTTHKNRLNEPEIKTLSGMPFASSLFSKKVQKAERMLIRDIGLDAPSETTEISEKNLQDMRETVKSKISNIFETPK